MRKILLAIAFAGLSAVNAQELDEAQAWAGPADEQRILEDMKAFFKDAESRAPGSTGNLIMEQRIAERFAASGLEHGEILFTAPCFLPGRTTVALSGGEPIPLLPLHPSLFRPGNFTEKDFEAPLVYLGRGAEDDLKALDGVKLDGAVALMDFDCGSAWLQFLRLGIRGFIFVETDSCERIDALSKLYTSEVAVPRFFVGAADGERLKEEVAGGAGAVAVRVRAEPSRWENKFLRDLWVLVPGSDQDLASEVCVITAPIDGNCVIPELSTGAQAGANLYLLMRLFEQFKENPPARSVLLVAVNAHTQNFRGERMLAWHLLVPNIEGVRDKLSSDLREQKLLLDYYGRLKLDEFRQEDEDMLLALRSLVDESAGKNITVKNAAVALAKRDVNNIKDIRLQLHQAKVKEEITEAEYQSRFEELENELNKYVNVLTLFNKVGIRTKLGDLSDEEREILRGYVDEILEFNRKASELNERDLAIDIQNSTVRDALKGRRVPFVICLDLDWASQQIGFCSMNTAGKFRWPFRWGSATCSLAANLDGVRNEGKPNLLLDTMTMRAGLTERYYFPISTRPMTQKSAVMFFHNAARTPAFSLMNAFTACGNSFLPTDTIDGLNMTNVARITAFVSSLLPAVLDDRSIALSSELPPADMLDNTFAMWSIIVKTFKFDELAASVYPDIPVPGSVAILRPDNPSAYAQPIWDDGIIPGEVVNADILLTDERASGVVYGLREPGASLAFHFDDDFTVVDYVIDGGEIHNKINSNNLRYNLMLALFRCVEFPLFATTDSSLLGSAPITVRSMMPLLGHGDSAPRKFGSAGVASVFSTKRVNPTAGAPAAFYFVPNESVKLLTDNKRLALNATPENFQGTGFSAQDEVGPDIFVAMAEDMSILNRARLNRLKDVANELVREFLERGDERLKEMKAAAAANRHHDKLLALYQAIGCQAKSYGQAKQTSDDMLKAVVVYMALLLPFCLFIQKLLFKFVKIEHELGMFALLFLFTFALFRFIHPAFRVAQAAEAIFIAFVMGALGLFVITILKGRFEGEMQLLFRSYLGGIHDDVGYSTVTQKALVIGVNNMKRRRIRTLLTTATIILVAFTMLSFTSISKKVNPTMILKAKEAPYTGIMFHWPGKALMDEASLAVLDRMFSGRGEVAVRRWLVAEDSAPFQTVSSKGGEARFQGILGLSKLEDGFLGRMPLLAGRYFSSDSAQEVLLSERAACLLGIDPSLAEPASIEVEGRTLKVVGLFDDERFRHLRDLNHRPIIPISQIARDTAFGREVEAQPGADEVDIDEGLLSYVDVVSLLVVPLGTAERMGAQAFSVSFKLPADAQIWPEADQLLTAAHPKFFMSSIFPFSVGESAKNIAGGVYYVGSNYKTSIGGLAVLIIPLFIASTIILNTMLGSVYERKKEIAVFNAVGLNPHHIGMFFLAESFVYGVIGSVGGYLIGQLLSIAINKFGLVKGINLNYSSLSVAYVIIFTIAVVLLSTLYPATVATRAAVPSGKRKWSLPEHDGNTMNVIFPFIYHPRIARGVIAYIDEYFARFTEASIGDLIAAREGQKLDKDEKGRDRISLEYMIALAPYDLGVTERLIFDLSYNERVQAYDISMRIARVSGQDSNWVTTNKPFLEKMRKYLLRWRNLDISRQSLYVQEANVLLGEADKPAQNLS